MCKDIELNGWQSVMGGKMKVEVINYAAGLLLHNGIIAYSVMICMYAYMYIYMYVCVHVRM
jgi:hypothetical protein